MALWHKNKRTRPFQVYGRVSQKQNKSTACIQGGAVDGRTPHWREPKSSCHIHKSLYKDGKCLDPITLSCDYYYLQLMTQSLLSYSVHSGFVLFVQFGAIDIIIWGNKGIDRWCLKTIFSSCGQLPILFESLSNPSIRVHEHKFNQRWTEQRQKKTSEQTSPWVSIHTLSLLELKLLLWKKRQ